MARLVLKSSPFADGLIFAGGAVTAIIVFLAVYSFLSPTPVPNMLATSAPFPRGDFDRHRESSEKTYFDDPSVTYTVGRPIVGWDDKRRRWLQLHPEFAGGERVLMLSGSQPAPCRSPTGDHFLLRFMKNKVDYCRIHGIELFYNTALLNPGMPAYWAKIPAVRAAMVAHPEAEWIWWVDSDAIFTDMDFTLPLRKYDGYNLVVNGWPHLLAKSWVSLNAGVFLIRNCQWSLDFMAEWASMGPTSPEYEQWGKTLKATFRDKEFVESDDQSALVYILLKKKDKWGGKIYLENEYHFQGYWLDIVGTLDNVTARHADMERRWPPSMRRRHAERLVAAYAVERHRRTTERGARRPFVTHFTGCQPCSGHRNDHYTREKCDEGMRRALTFADDQVLRSYGFRHVGPLDDDVWPLPFGYPAAR